MANFFQNFKGLICPQVSFFSICINRLSVGKNHDLPDLRVVAFCTFQWLKRKNKKAKMVTHSCFLYLLSLT